MNEQFQEASYVLEQIEKNGFKAYFVGGCVRDYCLDRPIKDVDIASSAKPKDIQRIFKKTIPVGIEHGTVIVRHNHVSYEVTTFRKEDKYEDYRRPSKVWFVDDLEEDLSRRDFTFNAMAMDRLYHLIDPFDGRKDLLENQIRTVGNPDLRFSEDPLRLMRACRFMSVYRMEIEEVTKAAIIKNVSLLKKISTERITIEFIKLLDGEHAGAALEFMSKSGIFSFLPYPLHVKNKKKLMDFKWNALQKETERWAAVILLMEVSDERDFLKRWKLPNAVTKEVLEILAASRTESWNKIDLYRAGIQTAKSGLLLRSLMCNKPCVEPVQKINDLHSEIPIRSRSDIPLNGENILQIKGKAPGLWVGKLFQEMEQLIVEGRLTLSETELIDWVKRWEEQ
jgi:tRNA nucleotidyltransferase (CCA-adding enzyme)